MGVVPVRSLNQVLALPRCLEQSRKHHPYILGQEAEDSLAGPETSSARRRLGHRVSFLCALDASVGTESSRAAEIAARLHCFLASAAGYVVLRVGIACHNFRACYWPHVTCLNPLSPPSLKRLSCIVCKAGQPPVYQVGCL